MRYLLVTHIAYSPQPGGGSELDRLWAEDLKGLAASVGPVTVAAPAVSAGTLQAWGTSLATLTATDGITLVPLPVRRGRFDPLYAVRLRRALRRAVADADLVHTSNLFAPDTALYFAHDLAVRRGKKTLFVVAEDFPDMLGWEWVRTAPNGLERWRRAHTLARTDRAVRRRVANASLTFLHTPAAVARYRLDAANAIAIRQPVHESGDVISAARLEARLNAAVGGRPLRLIAAARLRPLKGLDFLIRAVAILRERGVAVEATLYGSGPEQANLQALIAQLDLSASVTLAGPVASGPELRAALEAGDLFFMPHLTADFGRAFFDAMAAALPVVAFRSPASEDTVRHAVDGLLCPMADAESLAAAIARFSLDRDLLATASAAARRRAVENTRCFWNTLRAGWINELFAGTRL